MLTAVVCGEIFASPSAYAVARALEAPWMQKSLRWRRV